jgi:hypothetical protein
MTVALVAGVGCTLLLSGYLTGGAIYRWRYSTDRPSAADTIAQANWQLVMLSLVAYALAVALRGPWRLLPPAAAALWRPALPPAGLAAQAAQRSDK